MHTHDRAPLSTTTTTTTPASRPMIHYTSMASATPTLGYSTLDASLQGRMIPPTTKHGVDDPNSAVHVLVPVSVAAWVLIGSGCILCINGKGRAGRWVPKWYLDAEGTRRDKALVAAWWLAVLLMWPVILPVLLLRKLVRAVRKKVAAVRGTEMRGRDKGAGRASEV